MNAQRSFVLLVVLAAAASLAAQQPAATSANTSVCSLSQPPFEANRANFFNDQQEQWLGDFMADQQEPNYVLLPQKDSEELTRIGQKLLAQLPPTPIQYRFHVYDSSELNGFSLAGGYIYISRKLIADAKSEDEIAGVLAHEIGHIYTHQIATNITRQMSKMMGITSLGDRADVFNKYQMLMNAQWKFRSDLDESEAEKDELRADAVGLYAMVRAGYAPQAFATNLERIADSKGRNGSFLSDILGGTSEVGMRVRAARKTANGAPDDCRHRELKSSPEFVSFQQALVASRVNPFVDPTPGLASIALASPVRPGLNWVRFSPDGKYVLAQDERYVFVMSANPLKQLFKAYAPGASGAHFTPDSKHLVYHYQSLRVEDWDVETATLTGTHELFEYRGCWQSELSPDGKVLACVFRNREASALSLELFDVGSGKVVFNKEAYFLPDSRAQEYKQMTRLDWDPEELAIAFSPDSKYMIVAGERNNLALDLTSMRPVKMYLGLGGLVQGRIMFTASGQVLYDCDAGQPQIFKTGWANVCLADFPSGALAKKFVEGWESFGPVSKGDYLIAGSFYDSLPHLVDLTTGKPASLLKFTAADVNGKLLASESGKGGVTVGEIGSPTVQATDLPEEPLPYVRTALFSPDGRYLLLSNENRGAIWDLSANRQMVLARSFRGAWFDGAGVAYLQVAVSQARPGQNLRLDLKTGAGAETGKYDTEVRQMLDVEVQTHYLNLDEEKAHFGEVEVHDVKTGSLLWKRKFANGKPQISQQEAGVLIFSWPMEGETAWDEILHTQPVASSDENKERHQGVLTELVDSQTGKVLHQLITPEGGRTPWGHPEFYSDSPDERFVAAYGDLVAVHGNADNTVVYDVKTGKRLVAFFGQPIAGDGKQSLIAATNRNQEVMVFDASTGQELVHVTVDQTVHAARFLPDEKKLLVLTGNQRVYTLDVSGAGSQTAQK